jgi:hypothetical protein
VVHFAPELVVHFAPEWVVHYAPEYTSVARWVHSDWKTNLTRTFVPEFLFRFLGLHKFNQAGQMP